jgi:hypothetical protein
MLLRPIGPPAHFDACHSPAARIVSPRLNAERRGGALASPPAAPPTAAARRAGRAAAEAARCSRLSSRLPFTSPLMPLRLLRIVILLVLTLRLGRGRASAYTLVEGLRDADDPLLEFCRN